MPVYPLDGGQIFGALLWFVIGRARSMLVTAVVGLVGVAAIFWLALISFSPWLGLIGLFVALQCLASLRQARSLISMGAASRRAGVTCPSCRRPPPVGRYWRCDWCGASFDLFDANAGAEVEPGTITTLSLSDGMATSSGPGSDVGQCPACHTGTDVARCVHYDAVAPIGAWSPITALSPAVPLMPGVSRLRAPAAPSITPLVLGISTAIVALMIEFVAVLAYRSSSTAADAAVSVSCSIWPLPCLCSPLCQQSSRSCSLSGTGEL